MITKNFLQIDLVTSSLVFDYIEDFDELLQNVYSVMKDNARFVFSMSHPMSTAYDGQYPRYTGKFETGTPEQQGAYTQLFGAENIQYKFDLYFHWYNILHEYGHCLCDYYKSGTDDLNEELLVNRFAVSIWNYAGFEKELRNT